MEEITLLQNLAEISLPLMLIGTFYVLFTRTFWPWFTGPYAEERRQQKAQELQQRADELEQNRRREDRSADIARQVMDELKAVQLCVNQQDLKVTSQLTTLSDVISTLFNQQMRQIELWRQDMAYILRLYAEVKATQNGVSEEHINILREEDKNGL